LRNAKRAGNPYWPYLRRSMRAMMSAAIDG